MKYHWVSVQEFQFIVFNVKMKSDKDEYLCISKSDVHNRYTVFIFWSSNLDTDVSLSFLCTDSLFHTTMFRYKLIFFVCAYKRLFCYIFILI